MGSDEQVYERSMSDPQGPRRDRGKILRKTMRGIADSRDEAVPSTIDDASVLDTLRSVLRPSG